MANTIIYDADAPLRQAIANIGSSLTQSLMDSRNRQRQERLQKESEQRAFDRQKELFGLQEAAQMRGQQFQEDLRDRRLTKDQERNKLYGSVIGNVMQDFQQKQQQGENVSPFDVLQGVGAIQKQTGLGFNEAANMLNQYNQAEQLRERRIDRQEQREERDISREQRFRDEVLTKRPELAAEDLEDYMEMARRYSDIKDPQKRFRLADENYKKSQKVLRKFQEDIEGPSFYERAFSGLSDKKLNQLQNKVKMLKKDFNEDKIVKILKDNKFDEMEIEKIVSPLSNKEKEALVSIPKAVEYTPFGGSPRTMQKKELRDRQVENLPAFLIKAVSDGGSIRLIAEELINKGYTRDEVSDSLSKIVDNVDLTPRQQTKLMDIVKKPKTRKLTEIFGS